MSIFNGCGGLPTYVRRKTKKPLDHRASKLTHSGLKHMLKCSSPIQYGQLVCKLSCGQRHNFSSMHDVEMMKELTVHYDKLLVKQIWDSRLIHKRKFVDLEQ